MNPLWIVWRWLPMPRGSHIKNQRLKLQAARKMRDDRRHLVNAPPNRSRSSCGQRVTKGIMSKPAACHGDGGLGPSATGLCVNTACHTKVAM